MFKGEQKDDQKKKLVSDCKEFKRLRASIYYAVNDTKKESISCIIEIGGKKNRDNENRDDKTSEKHDDATAETTSPEDNDKSDSSDDDSGFDKFMKLMILRKVMGDCEGGLPDFVREMIRSGLIGEKKSGDSNDQVDPSTTVDGDAVGADNIAHNVTTDDAYDADDNAVSAA